jgi:purine-cytosine permease-like protein
MTVWFGTLGIIYLPATEAGDIAGFVVGMNMSMGALVLLFLLQADELFASGHSAETALKALPGPRLASPIPATFVTLAAIVVALPEDLMRAEGTFLLLGSVFIPLFGIVIADQTMRRESGRFAAVPLLAWAIGFLAYHWISPSEAQWWRDATEWLFADSLGLPYPLTEEVTWLGAAVPSFLVAFAVQLSGAAFLALVNPSSGVSPIKEERSG